MASPNVRTSSLPNHSQCYSIALNSTKLIKQVSPHRSHRERSQQTASAVLKSGLYVTPLKSLVPVANSRAQSTHVNVSSNSLFAIHQHRPTEHGCGYIRPRAQVSKIARTPDHTQINALVIDFGGGTCDVCIIQTTKEGDISGGGQNKRPTEEREE
jgi:hypothetical protein